MKKILYSFLLCSSFMMFAQNSNQPIVIVDGMLASKSIIDDDPNNMKVVNHFSDASKLPKNLKKFGYLAKNGITSVSVKENNYDKFVIENLNKDHKLDLKTPIYFNNILIEDTKMVILGQALAHIEVVNRNGNDMLSISTVEKTNQK